MLQAFVTVSDERFTVLDGLLGDDTLKFKRLCSDIPEFNYGQFLAEHSRSNCISVVASAGTGKTTVMVDRIMYLLQAESVDPSTLVMITFTNEATNQMSERLQKVMLDRFKLTGRSMYLDFMEGASQIRISTIDSFSLEVLKSIGVVDGYSSNLSVTAYRDELRRVITQLVNEFYGGSGKVKDTLGTNLYDAINFVIYAYDKIKALGIPTSSVDNMNWGTVAGDAINLQSLLRFVLSNIDSRLMEYRIEHDVVGLSDIVCDLHRAINAYAGDIPDLHMTHLFIDEFQDTNNEQIRLVSELTSSLGLSLFVVGDPKQSIYRFRGADDDAFNTLRNDMKKLGVEEITEYELVNNYRTDSFVLESINSIFRSWVRQGLLSSFGNVMSCSGDIGGDVVVHNVMKRKDAESILVHDVAESLADLRNRKSGGKVAILVRSNKQMDDVARICSEHRLPLITKRDEPFYLSDAVRDFYSMVSSYVYGVDPVSIFNYLATPYACMDDQICMSELMDADGDKTVLADTLLDYLENTPWERYEEPFKLNPAMSVIRSMMDEIPVIENYISILKRNLGDNPELIRLKAEKYRLNLDKLLAILHNYSSGDGIGLYHIYNFLKIAIATNRDEKEVEPDLRTSSVAYCMTVHNSKGLEFDTVIIPFNYNLNLRDSNELLFTSDFNEVGWKFFKDDSAGTISITNSNYAHIKEDDVGRSKREETRILYVAMTRTIRRLILYRYPVKGDTFGWSSLLGGI